jgi:hypothetical protein
MRSFVLKKTRFGITEQTRIAGPATAIESNFHSLYARTDKRVIAANANKRIIRKFFILIIIKDLEHSARRHGMNQENPKQQFLTERKIK